MTTNSLNDLRLNVAHFLSQFQPAIDGNYIQPMSMVPDKRIKQFADYIAAMGESKSVTGSAVGCKPASLESDGSSPSSPTNTETLIGWRSPSPAEVTSPEFNAIWNVIKTWDVNVPDQYSGCCEVTGSHVCAILDAISKPRGDSNE